ncbi:hypothetical protein [Paenibacillus sp. V4I5]|uniref:hypothetical protein n=1 Tax=Paenibacillus sp. V4I5 TaxID=3042306 RepID=UPI00278DF00D|nr:hypothetical protein [Paenibacillus sp. V4I5]MDQ0914773.1 hypothetical protein [Paenibacillus sp. V4I5]
MSGPDFLLSETCKYITADRANYSRFGGKVMAGAVLPQTDFDSYKPEEIAALGVNQGDYERFAWADITSIIPAFSKQINECNLENQRDCKLVPAVSSS